MGEAKRRGTFEQRKAAAIEREKNKPKIKYVAPPFSKNALEYLQLLATVQVMNNGVHLGER